MKFRRKSSVDVSPASTTDEGLGEDLTTVEEPDRRHEHGPRDAAEVNLEGDALPRVDLGGLMVTVRPGLELRLQLDEATRSITSLLLVGPDGALELRAFAAPRHSDIWPGIAQQIAAETARRGGTATEADGQFGMELRVLMPVRTPEGGMVTQPSRVLGIAGPRWMLRATFVGKPAVDPDPDGAVESALDEVVVVRGSQPMAPGDPLPLVMPADAQAMRPA